MPFDPSLMVYSRKRLTPEVLGEINEMIVRDAKERQVKEAESKDDDDDSDGQPGTGGNSGTMIVDATCAPSMSSRSACTITVPTAYLTGSSA